MKSWFPFSYEHHKMEQPVHYSDKKLLHQCLIRLKNSPPLINAAEVLLLKQHIAEASKGHAFLFQGGDCSELFSDCTQKRIQDSFTMMMDITKILTNNLKKPIIPIGRIAGQYAKPRSTPQETRFNVTLPAYRGDMINGHSFTQSARTPNPIRMLAAYQYANITINYLNSMNSRIKLTSLVSDSCSFYTSHEALHLPYEAALTKPIGQNQFINLGTHFPWIGVRTLSLDGAHVEYLRGIENPIGIKLGPLVNLEDVIAIIHRLNPQAEMGKIVLIHRFGKNHIKTKLPLLLETLSNNELNCAVMCDPMHGNTQMTAQHIKTRHFNDILDELRSAFLLHKNSPIPLAGVHFEMTSDPVTECIGGSCGLNEGNLSETYTSLIDPRLNYDQSLEIAQYISQFY